MSTTVWKVGIVGCGRIAGAKDFPASDRPIDTHAQAYHHHPRFELFAAVDPDAQALDRFQQIWNIPHGYVSLEEMLRRERLDVISLSSPNEYHYAQAFRILTSPAKPKLLLIEKPVCLRSEELSSLIGVAARSGVTAIVNHIRRFDPVHRQIANMIQEKRLGDLIEGRGTYYGGWLTVGVHFVDMLQMFAASELEVIRAIRSGSSRDNDHILEVELQSGDAKIRLEGFDETHYQIFDLELRFTAGRICLSNFSDRITIEQVEVNQKGERVLVPALESQLSGLVSPMRHVVESIDRHLRGENVLRGLGVELPQVVPTMNVIWKALALANGRGTRDPNASAIGSDRVTHHSEDLATKNGGPTRTKPWSDNFTLGEEEKKVVNEVMERGHLSLFEGSHAPAPPFSFWGGLWVRKLEQEWCHYYGVPYAVSMNSATSGLYAAIGALGLGYGDEVIVSPYSMTAVGVCPLIYGAIPIFADVQLETGCLDPKSIEAHITDRTRAVVVVHQFGIPADMDAVMTLARRHGLKVIEDCAQAHGAMYRGKYVGTIGDIGVFSLNVNKTIQSGEGGVCVTHDEELRYRLSLIRNHGEAVVGEAGYDNITDIIGFNYRLTEITAAIAVEQLKKLDSFNKIRIRYASYLNDVFSKYDCLSPLAQYPYGLDAKTCRSTYYLYPLRYLPEVAEVGRKELIDRLGSEGVIFFGGYVKPLYLHPLYQKKVAFKHGYPFRAPENQCIVTNYHQGACPNAEKLFFEQMLVNEHVRWPHTESDIEDIARAMYKVLQAIGKKEFVGSS